MAILAIGRCLHLDDVNLIIVFVVDIHVATVSMSVESVLKEFLIMYIPGICDKSALEILSGDL